MYHYTDGTAYAPTHFGETKNGVWIPKDPTGTIMVQMDFILNLKMQVI